MMKLWEKEKRGAPEGAEENPIFFQDILYILNCLDEEAFRSRLSYHRRSDEIISLSSYEYASYVRRQLRDLGDNIEISDDDNENHVEITIQNLFFLVSGEIKLSLNENISSNFTMQLIFKNNTFGADGRADNNRISINLYGGGFIDFVNNKFENTELQFNITSRDGLMSSDRKKNSNKDARLENNQIYAIQAPSYLRISFIKNNKIEKIDIYDIGQGEKFCINWTPYQEIETKESHAEINRNSFIILKEQAVNRGDKLQEFYLNREILKCDHHLIKQWPFWSSLQDQFILWFGRIVSNHGISWGLPLIWLIGFNFSLTFLIFAIACIASMLGVEGIKQDMDFWYIFAELFNPISNLTETAGVNKGFWMSLANVIQKVVFAVLLYELIRVGRRFTIK